MNGKNTQNSRRGFLKKGMAGIASLSLFPSFFRGESKAKKKIDSKIKKKIVYRTLGRTGIKVAVIGIGCYTTYNKNVIQTALDKGVVYIDTAPGYGRGNSEKMLGEVFKGRPRDSFVIATKHIGFRDNRTGLIPKNIDSARYKASFLYSINGSIKRMNLNYVDVFCLQSAQNPKLVGLALVKDTLTGLKKEGKTRFLGVSIHNNEPEMIRATVDAKIYDVILTSYNFRQPHQEEVKSAIAYAAKAGVGVIAMKTMAGVYWDRERMRPINGKAALKWVLQDKNVNTTVPGIETFDQLELDMSVMEDLILTPKEREDLKLGQKTGMSGLYCDQCGRCRSQCRYNLDIPTMMRSYMYAYGYKNTALAKETLQSVDLHNTPCTDCRTCTVTCAMGFDIHNRILDIVRLNDVPEDFLV